MRAASPRPAAFLLVFPSCRLSVLPSFLA